MRAIAINSKNRLLAVLIGTAWIVVIACGARILMDYENAPGDAGAPPQQWPVESNIHRDNGTATLIVLAHPRCPCTEASIGELAKIMVEIQGRARAYVLFTQPENQPESWSRTSLWTTAAAIPGVTGLADINGQEAQRFHIETSGHALLFDASGQLLFSGGITGSRGHEGDNAGESAVVSLLQKGGAERNRTLVFGCSLFAAKSPTATNFCVK